MITRGQKINDRYQILRTIGEGGMANVYLAHDLILDRDVAVKILRGDLADDEKFVRRFQREAISASSLSHPNIVEMYDVGEDNGKYYIVMEYVEGKTLKSLIKKRGSLTLPEVIDIMTQLTSAIACAHDSNIIHRDIKPQNVLIKEDGLVKITDFGIAMALNSNELTQTNSVMGSVHYLPPEQANGKGSTVKSDIYSLGIVMFELLTGQLPFKGDNAVEIAIKQMKNQIPSVCNINSLIPQSVENIIIKACAKNPKNRYNNVIEMYNDIQTCLDEERKNEKRYVYQYPETENLENTKELKTIKEIPKNKTELEQIEEQEENQKSGRIFIILGLISALIIVAITLAIIIIPKTGKVKEITVPDVSKLTIAAAESKLKEAGFEINEEREEKNSKEIEEGYVIGTNPPEGVKRKKGTSITLIISSGEKGIEIENYVGENYHEIKGKLEAYGIKVVQETKDIEKDEKNTVKENEIIEQRPIAGTKLVEGDTITLVIPNLVVKYPNFVEEKWTKDAVQKFCEEYNISVQFEEQETDSYEEGTIIKQDRVAGTQVRQGYPLKITIAIAKQKPKTEIEEKPTDEKEKKDEKQTTGEEE
jgi:serine/threonine-protein kinase